MNYKGRLVFELVEVTEKIMKLDNYKISWINTI